MKVYILSAVGGVFVSAHATLESAQAALSGARWIQMGGIDGKPWWSNIDPHTSPCWIEEHEVIE